MDGFSKGKSWNNHGKSQSKMDDEQGYNYFGKPPNGAFMGENMRKP